MARELLSDSGRQATSLISLQTLSCNYFANALLVKLGPDKKLSSSWMYFFRFIPLKKVLALLREVGSLGGLSCSGQRITSKAERASNISLDVSFLLRLDLYSH